MDKLLANKVGMTQLFDEQGNVIGVTVLETEPGQAERCVPGELVSVAGRSIGKGFAGTVKRHHHHRGPMSHGSKSHRIPGSIGAGTTPGRVLKGRKMPGHLGAVQVTVKNLKVIKVDAAQNLILVAGGVPGKRGNLVRLTKRSAAKVKA